MEDGLRQNSGGIVRLKEVNRINSYLGNRLRIASVQFNRGEPICHGQPFSVTIEFETYGPVEDVSLGIGFSTLEGVRLFNLDTDLTDKRVNFEGAHHGCIEGVLPRLDLHPGHYLYYVESRSGDGHVLDYIAGTGRIEVQPSENTPPWVLCVAGSLRLPARWDWNCTAAGCGGEQQTYSKSPSR